MGAIFDQWGQYLPDLLQGLLVSLKLVGASLAIGLPLGVGLAIATGAGGTVIRVIGITVVELGRAVPVLVLLQVVFYGLPSIHVILSSFWAGAAALAFITAAYSSEVFRAGIASVGHEQWDAAAALGVSRVDTYRSIILPQGVRVALPAVLGLAIQIFQATALAFTISVPELLQRAYAIGDQTFRFLSVLTLAGLIYAAVVIPASFLVRLLETRMGKHLSIGQR